MTNRILETESIEKLFLDLKNGHYEDVDIYLADATKELNKIKSAVFWNGWCYPKGATCEEVENEICDYRNFMESAGEVYDYITNGRISKINTKAHVIIDEMEQIWERKQGDHE